MAAPTITSGTITEAYVTIGFSEGVYATSAHNTGCTTASFVLTFTKGTGTAIAAYIRAVKDTSNAAPTGGEGTLRIYFYYTGVPNGNETIHIKASSGSTSVFSIIGTKIDYANQTTGEMAVAATFITGNSATTITNNDYVDVTYNKGLYTNNTNGYGNGACLLTDFAATVTNGTGMTVAATVLSVKTPAEAALAGGETVIRFHLKFTGITTGDETVNVHPALDTSIYDYGGLCMPAVQTSPEITVLAEKVLYLSKTGDDGNSGYTALLAKKTFAGIKAVALGGLNHVYVGVGNYVEVVTWDTVGEYIHLQGDYDGAIFGEGAGEVINTQSADMGMSYITEIDRITLKLSAVNKKFALGAIDVDHSVIFSYVKLQQHASGGLFIDGDWSNFTFSHCTLVTGAAGQNVDYLRNVIFDTCDFLTDGKSFGGIYELHNAFFDACSIIWSGNLLIGKSSICIHNSTFKQSAAGSNILNNGNYFVGHGWCRFTDVTFLDNAGANINFYTNVHVNTSSFDFTKGDVNYVKNLYEDTNYILMANCNANGINILLAGGSRLLDNYLGETYLSRDVQYYNYTPSTVPYFVLPIEGWEISKTYNITFDYKKMKNSVNADYDIRFGILRGDQMIIPDLVITPANALDYDNYLASAHTYDTWYRKVLTFSATANDYDQYYLVFYTPIAEYNFKITDFSIDEWTSEGLTSGWVNSVGLEGVELSVYPPVELTSGWVNSVGLEGVVLDYPSNTFGSLLLNIINYKVIPGKLILAEKELLGEYTNTNTLPNTTIQGTGRRRTEWHIEGWSTRADYNALLGYKYAASIGAFYFLKTLQKNVIIWELSRKEIPLPAGRDNYVWYAAIFKEVS